MKKLIVICVMNILVLICISGCNKEDSYIQNSQSTSQSTIKGNWIIDKVQIQRPPSTTTPSAFMKASLSALGLVATSTVGEGAVSFGAVKWEYTPVYLSSNLKKIKFIDDKTGWIVNYASNLTDKGILKTTDGGLYWNWIYHGNPSNFIFDLSFGNDKTGFAIAADYINSSRAIYKSVNGGFTWDINYTGSYLTYNSVCFLNEQTGWVVGNTSNTILLLKTTNSGTNWNQIYSNQFGSLSYINFYNSNLGVAIGTSWNNESIILLTKDGGNKWNNLHIQDISLVKSIQFLDEQNGYAICTDGKNSTLLYKTNDGGAIWEKVQCIKGASSMCFLNTQTGYVTGNSSIAKTTNAGKSWFIESSGTEKNLNDIVFLKSGQGIAIGNQGTIIRQTNNIDEYSWSLSGYITNPLIKSITNSSNDIYTASGTYRANSSNEIYFDLSNYSGGLGKVKSARCTYLLNSYLNLTFNLTDNEQWLVVLRR